jgi:crotonobetainyl-CoA:carnitine CoA-transferase CaiB-like acyl-CoA transferase
VSLIGAALLMQVQRFVAVGGAGDRGSDAEALDPYYRVHACADGFVALACLNEPQRRAVCAVVGRADPHAANPQAPPRDAAEHARRRRHAAAVEAAFARMTVHDALAALEARAIPAGALRPLGALFDDPQARANGLVQEIEQPAVGTVSLLGSVFKVDGGAPRARRPAPGLDEHRAELLPDAAQPSAGSTWART